MLYGGKPAPGTPGMAPGFRNGPPGLIKEAGLMLLDPGRLRIAPALPARTGAVRQFCYHRAATI